METHTLKCSNCHALLNLKQGMMRLFCEYCGTEQVIKHKENKRGVDRAASELALMRLKDELRTQQEALEKLTTEGKRTLGVLKTKKAGSDTAIALIWMFGILIIGLFFIEGAWFVGIFFELLALFVGLYERDRRKEVKKHIEDIEREIDVKTRWQQEKITRISNEIDFHYDNVKLF